MIKYLFLLFFISLSSLAEDREAFCPCFPIDEIGKVNWEQSLNSLIVQENLNLIEISSFHTLQNKGITTKTDKFYFRSIGEQFEIKTISGFSFKVKANQAFTFSNLGEKLFYINKQGILYSSY